MADPRDAGHLPNQRSDAQPAPPEGLPRHRCGTAPQMRSRYPDWDVLAHVDQWDAQTRHVVLARVNDPPTIRFFDAAQAATLHAFCDTVTAQDQQPRIPVLEMVDDRLTNGRGVGYRYADLPPDGELWKRVADALDDDAHARAAKTFADLDETGRLAIVKAFADGDVHGPTWQTVNVAHAWSVVMRDVLTAFYSHPWSWNEIGFAGPAYPRGFSRLAPGQRETWEADEAFTLDPVKDTRKRGLP